MNFFQEQERARRHTLLLVGIFALAVLTLIVITIVFLTGLILYSNGVTFDEFMVHPSSYIEPKTIYEVVVSVILVVGGGSLYKYYSLSSGGKVVAVALGAQQVNRNTTKPEEKKLLNVVDEMAIASGISTPTVFVMDEEGINAFAAGLTLDDAVVCVTRGCIEKLDREELQGVVAHEFSHIFNGDMRLNLQLTATLHGILLIGLIGQFILRSTSRRRYRYRSTSSKNNSSGLYVIVLAVGLIAIGYIGTFFGSIIKANVSRKREYLADATAVQYTRYPDGISGALKKIAYYSSELHSPVAETYSHLYFAEGVHTLFTSLMATHPPLKDRIKKIEPRWNGRLPDYGKNQHKKASRAEEQALKRQKHETKKEVFTQGAIAAAMMQVGQVKEESVEKVQKEIKALPKELKARLGDPLGAQAVLLFLLYDVQYKETLFKVLKEKNPYLLLEFASFLKQQKDDLKDQSALLVSLSLNTLKSLSLEQYKNFKSIVSSFIQVDKKVTLFEWSLQYIIQRPLEIHLQLRKPPKRSYSNLGAMKGDVELLYSMLAQEQFEDDFTAQQAFGEAKKAIQAGALQYMPKTEITHERFIEAMRGIESAKPMIAERIFEGILHLIKADNEISNTENAFVHAVAQMMQIPLPREFKLESEAAL